MLLPVTVTVVPLSATIPAESLSLIVLLLIALSLSFDELVLVNQVYGASLLAAGFCYAVAISEGVLRSLQMRLAPWYRLPYYLLLALLFFYPLGLAHLSFTNQDAIELIVECLITDNYLTVLTGDYMEGAPPGTTQIENGWAWQTADVQSSGPIARSRSKSRV